MKELNYIYLEPSTCACPTDGAMWCEDMQTCDNCDKPYTQYIRADLTVNISKLQELIAKPTINKNKTFYSVSTYRLQKLIDENSNG